jgi:hypothetical protein
MFLLLAVVTPAIQQTVPSFSRYITTMNNAARFCAPFNAVPEYTIRINDYREACGSLCENLYGNFIFRMDFVGITIAPSIVVTINGVSYSANNISNYYMFGQVPWPSDGLIRVVMPSAAQAPFRALYTGSASINFTVYSQVDNSLYKGTVSVSLAKNTFDKFTSALTNSVALDGNGCLKLTFSQPCVAMPTSAVVTLESTAYNPTEVLADQIGLFESNTAVQCNLLWNGYRTDSSVSCELQNRRLIIRNLFKTAGFLNQGQKLDVCFVKNPLTKASSVNFLVFESEATRLSSANNFFIQKILPVVSTLSFPFYVQSYSMVSQKVNDPFDLTVSVRPLIEFVAKANYSFNIVMPSFYNPLDSLNYGMFNVRLSNSDNPAATGVAVYTQMVGSNTSTGVNQLVTFMNSPFVFQNGATLKLWGIKNPNTPGNYNISFKLSINGVEFSQPFVLPINIV